MGFVERSFGGGLVADEESEVFWEAGLVGLVGEGLGLEAEGSPGEPLIVRHSLDEELFAGGGGVEFVDQLGSEGLEFFRVFAGDEGGLGKEAVGAAVHGGTRFTFFGARISRLLGV